MPGSEARAFAGSNRLLARLEDRDREALERYLEPVALARGTTLFAAGEPVEFVHFPCGTTIVSLMVTTAMGEAVETASVGREGAVGGVVSRGLLPAFSSAVVQSSGSALRISVVRLQQIKATTPTIRNLLTRYADCLLAQTLQSAACYALHPLETRSARWLLTTQDRIGSDELPVTQEFLASSLGVQRSYVSRVLQILQADGLIRLSRGRIFITDRDTLTHRTCECYGAIRHHFDRVLSGVYPAGKTSDPEALTLTNRDRTNAR